MEGLAVWPILTENSIVRQPLRAPLHSCLFVNFEGLSSLQVHSPVSRVKHRVMNSVPCLKRLQWRYGVNRKCELPSLSPPISFTFSLSLCISPLLSLSLSASLCLSLRDRWMVGREWPCVCSPQCLCHAGKPIFITQPEGFLMGG